MSRIVERILCQIRVKDIFQVAPERIGAVIGHGRMLRIMGQDIRFRPRGRRMSFRQLVVFFVPILRGDMVGHLNAIYLDRIVIIHTDLLGRKGIPLFVAGSVEVSHVGFGDAVRARYLLPDSDFGVLVDNGVLRHKAIFVLGGNLG